MSPFLLWIGLAALCGIVVIDQLPRRSILRSNPFLRRQAQIALAVGLAACLVGGFCFASAIAALLNAPAPIGPFGGLAGAQEVTLLFFLVVFTAYTVRSRVAWRVGERAMLYLRRKRYQEAGDIYARLVAQHPKRGAGWYGLAVVRHLQYRYTESLDAWDNVLALGPASGQERNRLLRYWGTTLAATHHYDDKALAIFDQVLRDEPRDAYAWANRAELLERAGHHEAALEAAAMTQDPRAFPLTLIQRCWVTHIAADALNALGQHDEALKVAEQSFTMANLDKARSYRAQAIALRHLGRPTEAQEVAERGLEEVEHQLANAPIDVSDWKVKAGLLQLLGREAEAAVTHAQALIAGW